MSETTYEPWYPTGPTGRTLPRRYQADVERNLTEPHGGKYVLTEPEAVEAVRDLKRSGRHLGVNVNAKASDPDEAGNVVVTFNATYPAARKAGPEVVELPAGDVPEAVAEPVPDGWPL